MIVLAAGRSRRMGSPKLLLPWGHTTVIGHLLEQWRRLGVAQLGIVCAQDAGTLPDELNRLDFPADHRIVNPDPDRGMFSSIQCAAQWPGWQAGLTHWLITLGDQPQLRIDTLRELLGFAASHPDKICQPRRAARRKHPVVLPGKVFFELKKSAAGDLKQFLEQHAGDQAGFESADEGLDFDLDTPADYARLKP